MICPTCQNRGFLSSPIGSIPPYHCCPACLNKDDQHQPLGLSNKQLIYECDGKYGNAKIYFYWSKNGDPLTASWPFYFECYKLISAINFHESVLNLNLHYSKKEKAINDAKRYANGKFKSIQIYPYAGSMLTHKLEVYDWDKDE